MHRLARAVRPFRTLPEGRRRTTGRRQRTACVALGLLVALATVLGVTCLCAYGQFSRPLVASTAYDVAYDMADGHVGDHASVAPGEHRCGDQKVADTPTTGPVPQPQPVALPCRVDARPVVVAATVPRHGAAPRAPDLHVLQVLRT